MAFLCQQAEWTKTVSLLRYKLDHVRSHQAFQGPPSPSECNPKTSSGPVGPAVCFSFPSSLPCSLLLTPLQPHCVLLWPFNMPSRYPPEEPHLLFSLCGLLIVALRSLDSCHLLGRNLLWPNAYQLFGHVFLVTAIHHLIYFCLSPFKVISMRVENPSALFIATSPALRTAIRRK